LERALEDAAASATTSLDADGVERTLRGLDYDADGLDRGGGVLGAGRAGPVPLSRLARALGTTPRSLVEHVEPWLFLRGFARMMPGGRTTAPRVRLMAARGGAPNVRHMASRAHHAT
jgi:Holliday junction resolvasome RuvABC ATP-dependent DNA helicase subunit